MTDTDALDAGLTDAADAVAAPEGVGDRWKSIDTAPKDGTLITAVTEAGAHYALEVLRFPYPLKQRWNGSKWEADDGRVYEPQPTHWKPAAPEGVGLTRYAYSSAFMMLDEGGSWVRHEDAAAAIAAEKTRVEQANKRTLRVEEALGEKNRKMVAAEAERDALKEALELIADMRLSAPAEFREIARAALSKIQGGE